MWGPIDSPEKATGWLDDVVAAEYDGVATFDSFLRQLTDDMDFECQLNDRGLQLASVNISIQRDFDRLRATCELMQRLGAHHLVTVGGLATRKADMNEIAELLNQIGEIALAYDVRACYHNHTDHIGETLEEIETLMTLTDPTKFFGFLDVGHATKDFIGHPVADRASIFLQRNWDQIDFIEFKDWSEEHNLNTAVGAGMCNYESVFNILQEKNYTGWITVEQNGPAGNKTALAQAKASREFIRRGLGV
ncbi:MAG: sugar phosphate isomerase/epimerase family protein [Chloroflexota bacterium]